MLSSHSTIQDKPFYTVVDFATLVGRNHRTILNTINSKKPRDNHRKAMLPPFRRVAGRYVVSRADLGIWLQTLPVANAVVPTRGRPRNSQTKTQ